MAFVALIFVFFAGLTFFNLGGTTPSTGMGTVEQAQAPKASTTAAGRAVLSLKSMTPVVVAGRGFKSGERVRISGIATAKQVRASNAGAFTMNLGRSSARCNGFTLVAIGSQGSRASLNFSQLLCVAP